MTKTDKKSLIGTKRFPLYRGKTEFAIRRTGEKAGEWVYGYFTYNCVDHLYIARIERSTGSEYGEPVDYIGVDYNTVGRETFKTDKNGYDIYEDDVLKYDCYEDGELVLTEYFIVYWNVGLAGFMLKSSISKMPVDMDDVKYCEIVGNIHDNPEYLKFFEVA